MVGLGHKWEERRQGGREEWGPGVRGPTCVPRSLVNHAHVAAFVRGLELPGAVQELALKPEGLPQSVGGVGKSKKEDEDEGESEEERQEACHGWCVGGEGAILAASSSSWRSSGRSGQRETGQSGVCCGGCPGRGGVVNVSFSCGWFWLGWEEGGKESLINGDRHKGMWHT